MVWMRGHWQVFRKGSCLRKVGVRKAMMDIMEMVAWVTAGIIQTCHSGLHRTHSSNSHRIILLPMAETKKLPRKVLMGSLICFLSMEVKV